MILCKICNSKTKNLIDTKKNIAYHKCLSCGFIFIDDKNIVTGDVEKKHYEKHENSFEDLGYTKMFQDFVDIVVVPLKKDIHNALDFGCGFAPVLSTLLQNIGMNVDTYDYYFKPSLEYQNKKYDLITSTEVFEHLKNPVETLQNLVQSTNKNGYIILMTKFPPQEDDDFLKWWYRRDITHISFFTPKSFQIIARQVGLNFIKTINDNIVIFQK